MKNVLLSDVFTEEDYKSINNYKLFSQSMRPLLSKENPKVRIVAELASVNFCVVFLILTGKTMLKNRIGPY